MTRSLAVTCAAAALSLTAGCSSLPKAAHDGDLAAVREYLAKGGSANARFADGGDCPLLFPAADGGQVATVRALLDAGADPNAVCRYGYTPLHMAAGQQWPAVARLLLERGAGPSLAMRDEWGNTPLLLAVANPKRKDQWVYVPSGAVATSQAAGEPSAELLEIMLDAGADVNAPTARGNTPLHIAAYKGHAGAVRLLLARGANRAARNPEGATPLDLARAYRQDAVVAILGAP